MLRLFPEVFFDYCSLSNIHYLYSTFSQIIWNCVITFASVKTDKAIKESWSYVGFEPTFVSF